MVHFISKEIIEEGADLGIRSRSKFCFGPLKLEELIKQPVDKEIANIFYTLGILKCSLYSNSIFTSTLQ